MRARRFLLRGAIAGEARPRNRFDKSQPDAGALSQETLSLRSVETSVSLPTQFMFQNALRRSGGMQPKQSVKAAGEGNFGPVSTRAVHVSSG